MRTTVELEGVDGSWWTLAGPQAGDRGVHLATKPKGCFYDPPVKVVSEEPGNFPGARYLNHRILRRDIVFGVEILNDRGEDSWISRDSEWRKAWAFDRDSRLHVTTDRSGHRVLNLRLLESPELADGDDTYDPDTNPVTRTIMTCVAYDPFWYGDDVVYPVETETDTRFDPSLWTPPWPWQELPQETLTITVDPSDGRGGLNPTDQEIWLKWTVPASQEMVPEFPWPFPPGIEIPWERAPFTQYVIPDYSYEDEKLANRRLKTPGLIYGEDCLIDTDPRVEQFQAANDSPVWARTNGVRFKHYVPPYTKSQTFEITASGVAPGQMITLRIPRPWSRPWGLE
ncbi:minor tail protein [Mycobacterium phage Danforth]|uniref:Minor tail protein n=1 Tax=Mycobacterium phage Smeadley TaxID=1673873 RepID=A0A0H4U250_9CAUD|nr:minor tail protein [Mycobacterium phage Smeadley]AKQ07591.1 minor tail protein [Mycobacterium phage Smeadley]QJD50125.1 minor tail protein [Mycobacterium phage Danforth]